MNENETKKKEPKFVNDFTMKIFLNKNTKL